MTQQHRTRSLAERAAGEREYMARSGIRTLINSLSGGVDSSTVAAISKQAAPDGALGLILPCSTPEEMKGERLQDVRDAERVAAHLGIPAVTIDLSDLWQQAAALFSAAARELAEKAGVPLEEERLQWAIHNMKPTLRIMTAGFFADTFRGLMMGTGNGVEYFLGYFSIRGDGISDRQPIRDCTKEEVRAMAASAGLPEDLVHRVPTAGLWPGQTDEGELGFSYADADRFLVWILNRHVAEPCLTTTLTVREESVEAILADPGLPVAAEVARRIIDQNRRTAFKRRAGDLEAMLAARGLAPGATGGRQE
ncbi:NAD(+) synthase [Symbiobacterium thermophilum]|uniref:NH(3)-dependent NAD(+) synthetase n=1 Tax=Symbiobacterium thermophilum TaxID=2734 RepID=A0A953I7D9_SYMTR|nr:NAD(+) synthase [Symbiobacterium thermophilum]MBY6275833.1 NAD(+) synthase [Symbiobacterium thermophilum]